MRFSCPNCGSNKCHKNGNVLICDICGETIDADEMAEINSKNEANIKAFIGENEKLFSINYNDGKLTPDYVASLIDEVKKSIDQQQDDNYKLFKNGLLADLYEKLDSLTNSGEKAVNESQTSTSGFERKIDKCEDIEDLIEKGNFLRRKIEASFYKAKWKDNPLFVEKNGKPLISKNDFCDFVEDLFHNNVISEFEKEGFLNRANSGKILIDVKDPLKRLIAPMPIRFMGAGLSSLDASTACADWGLLNACSHKGAETNPEILKHFKDVQRGKDYLRNKYRFYKERGLVD